MRADNRGEGGILALLALVRPERARRDGLGRLLVALGLFGAALLYGDGIITPPSRCSARSRGSSVATPRFEHLRRADRVRHHPRRCSSCQRRGTARRRRAVRPGDAASGSSCIAVLGVTGIAARARRCSRRSIPWHAVTFFARERLRAASASSARWSWWSPAARRSTPTWGTSASGRSGSRGSRVVLPALLLNYFGQGALLLTDPAAAREPVLLAGAGAGRCIPMVGARDRGGGRRLAGADLRRLLAHPAGGAARLLPAGRRSSTPRRPRSARSTSRRSTSC